MLVVIVSVLLLLAICTPLIYFRGWKEGIHLSSTIASSIATVTISYFAYLQINEIHRVRDVEVVKDEMELDLALSDLLDVCDSTDVLLTFYFGDELSKSIGLDKIDKKSWLEGIQQILESQLENQKLLNNKNLSFLWRRALDNVKRLKKLHEEGQEVNKDFSFYNIADVVSGCLDIESAYYKEKYYKLKLEKLYELRSDSFSRKLIEAIKERKFIDKQDKIDNR